MYYLTGFDSTGFTDFTAMLIGAGDEPVLFCRPQERLQARCTSTIGTIVVWRDGEAAEPERELAGIVAERVGRSGRIGIELNAWGMTARRWQRLTAAFGGDADLIDASDLVSRIRVVKSPAELDYIRRAADLADRSLAAAAAHAVPGAGEGAIVAAMQRPLFQGGGDYPNGLVIGSGVGALMVRGHTGYRDLGAVDQLQLEFAAAYRHYHAALMRTVLTGRADPRQQAMHAACVDALAACQACCRPGATFGDVFDAHARVLDAAGFGEHRLQACGYSLGATFGATWMDYPMLYAGSPATIEPGMVIFMHMILLDTEAGLAMSLGETVAVGPDKAERLSAADWDLVVNG